MLIDAETIQDGSTITSDIGVVGAGPAGIVLALELAQAGYDVALLESGRLDFSEAIQNLGDANHFDPQFHAPMSECTRRQIGGTSNIWGGRCVPYDPVDFAQRNHIPNSDWPVTYEELEVYFQRACDYFLCGRSEFDLNQMTHIEQKSIVPGLPDGEVLTSTLERWSLPTNFGKEYLAQLKQSKLIKLFYGLTCTEIVTNDQGVRVELLQAKTLGGKNLSIKCRKYILAGGALNNTRLLLASDRHNPGGIGNHSGLLGKFYMGHLSGDIAIAHFTTPPKETVFGFDRDLDHTYIRRRFSFAPEFLQQQKLANTVGWLGAPDFGDFSHQNGILSSAYIALNLPILKTRLGASTAIRRAAIGNDKGVYYPHIINILKDFGEIVSFIPSFGYGRFVAKRKIPALFVYSAANEYPLHYHSEQVPNPDSTVSLSEERDELGMRRLNIDLRFTDQDIESVVKAHQHWDRHLRKHECGYLEYLTDDLEASVWSQAGDGFHQVGTTRMSKHPSKGIVGSNCNIHGFDDLFVASSSTFVTSGQANSTFMIVAFALRLADYLKQEINFEK
ncbi:MAG: FAD-dependent oxidoreductase [Pleurocapsa sp.]